MVVVISLVLAVYRQHNSSSSKSNSGFAESFSRDCAVVAVTELQVPDMQACDLGWTV